MLAIETIHLSWINNPFVQCSIKKIFFRNDFFFFFYMNQVYFFQPIYPVYLSLMSVAYVDIYKLESMLSEFVSLQSKKKRN